MAGRNNRHDGAVGPGELADGELKARPATMVQPGGYEHGERGGIALHLGYGGGAVVPGQAEPERNLEGDDEGEREQEKTREQPPPH